MHTNSTSRRITTPSEFHSLGKCEKNISRISAAKKGAFSLIEVVLALGVVSFAFIGLFGLLPVALNAFNSSIDSTIQSQISESVITQLKQQKFSTLVSMSNQTGDGKPYFYTPTSTYTPSPGYYYDDQGKLLGTQNPTNTPPSDYVYCAGAQVYYDSAAPIGVQPWDSTIAATTVTSQTPQPMATLVVTVRKISAPNAARTFTAFVANNGL